MRRMLLASCLLAGVVGAVTGVGGCATAQSGFIEGPIYPGNITQTATLDIQVFRDDTRIRFTNTTARSIPACRMWVNAWFSRELPGVAVGETVELSLFDFKDQYGDEFRAGGFFATDTPMKLVLAQLEIGDELMGLVVVNEFDE